MGHASPAAAAWRILSRYPACVSNASRTTRKAEKKFRRKFTREQNLLLTFGVYWSVLVVTRSVRTGMTNESTVMFTGNVTHKLDPKSRLAIPAGWRAAQDVELSLIDAMSDGYPILKCYTREAFAEKMMSIRTQSEARGIDPGDIDRYIGIITGRSIQAEVSSQGKLLIPKAQRERIKLTETATIVGRGSYFEIWAPADFEAVNSPEAIAKLELDKLFHILS